MVDMASSLEEVARLEVGMATIVQGEVEVMEQEEPVVTHTKVEAPATEVVPVLVVATNNRATEVNYLEI